MAKVRILLLNYCADAELARSLKSALEAAKPYGVEFKEADLLAAPLDAQNQVLSKIAPRWGPNVVLLAISQDNWQLLEAVISALNARFQNVPVVVASNSADPKKLYGLLKLGADDFLTTPFNPIDMVARFWRLQFQQLEEEEIVAQLKKKLGLKQLIGQSPPLVAEIKKIPAVARCDATVLIMGETGTGKELFARGIHYLSPRADKPFVPINCGAIPVDLVENELFGHDAGAFTSATSSTIGLFCEAEGGTVFLDEIDCLPVGAQVKLLRFLQEKEFRRVGSNKTCKANVRVLAASNLNLEEAVRAECFRQDLYYRLNVVAIALPPLRERKEDIPLLAQHFLTKYALSFVAPARELTTAALEKLLIHDWPGNVRELENVIERSVVMSQNCMLHPDELQLPDLAGSEKDQRSFKVLKARAIARFELNYIRSLLTVYNGNITRAAKSASKNRRAFWELMRRHNIKAPRSPL